MNLNFSDGLKEYTINNDTSRVIRINPSDIGIIKRLQAAQERIDNLKEVYSNVESTVEALAECDKELKSIIDDVFGSPVSDVVFGSANCLSPAGGACLYENFLNAVLPEIEKNVKAEQKASEERIRKYTDKVI